MESEARHWCHQIALGLPSGPRPWPISNRWRCCFLLPGERLAPLPRVTHTGLLVQAVKTYHLPPLCPLHLGTESVETFSFANIPALWTALSSSAWHNLAGTQLWRCSCSHTQLSCLSFVGDTFCHQRRGTSSMVSCDRLWFGMGGQVVTSFYKQIFVCSRALIEGNL